jgi:hypothetical protein
MWLLYGLPNGSGKAPRRLGPNSGDTLTLVARKLFR